MYKRDEEEEPLRNTYAVSLVETRERGTSLYARMCVNAYADVCIEKEISDFQAIGLRACRIIDK